MSQQIVINLSDIASQLGITYEENELNSNIILLSNITELGEKISGSVQAERANKT